MQVKLALLVLTATVLFSISDGKNPKHTGAISKTERQHYDKAIKKCCKTTGASEDYINGLYTLGSLTKPKEENCFFACYHQTVGTMDKNGNYNHLELLDGVFSSENLKLARKCVNTYKNENDICLKAYLTEMCYIADRID